MGSNPGGDWSPALNVHRTECGHKFGPHVVLSVTHAQVVEEGFFVRKDMDHVPTLLLRVSGIGCKRPMQHSRQLELVKVSQYMRCGGELLHHSRVDACRNIHRHGGQSVAQACAGTRITLVCSNQQQQQEGQVAPHCCKDLGLQTKQQNDVGF